MSILSDQKKEINNNISRNQYVLEYLLRLYLNENPNIVIHQSGYNYISLRINPNIHLDFTHFILTIPNENSTIEKYFNFIDLLDNYHYELCDTLDKMIKENIKSITLQETYYHQQ